MENFSRLVLMLSLRQIQYFVVLAHARSFTEAAERLSITQPALTSAIRQMEETLGGRLFERSAQYLRLTTAGTSVLPLAEHLLGIAGVTFRDMAGTFTTRARTVRLGFIASASNRVLDWVRTLQEHEPLLRFEFHDLPNELLVDAVRRGIVDLGIGVDDSASELGFRCEALLKDEIVAVVRRDGPADTRGPMSWAALASHDVATFRRGDIKDIVKRTLAKQGYQFEFRHEMEYSEPLYGLVRADMAVAVMSTSTVESLSDPLLSVVRLGPPVVKRQLSLMQDHHPPRSTEVALCAQWFRSQAQRSGSRPGA